ncbi:MAG: hypothetical protein ACMUEL_09235 [Flavobacteriales bacterium Tduv]
MFRLFGVENKEIGSILRSIAQISFSELYMECFTRKSQFFKRLNTSDLLGRDGERNKKNI